jgi:serine/threonine protein kinase
VEDDAPERDGDEGRPTEAMDVMSVHESEPALVIEEVPHGLHELLPGTNAGGYIIDGELGRGGMGVVYSAKHPVIGKRAAIKVLKPSLSNNPATIERFIQEARSVNAIGHPNIVDIFDFDVLPDGRRFLVMDLLEGESLRKRVKRGPLHVHEAVLVIDEIASALDAAHSKGFIHRDLKPDNVYLVQQSGRFDVKLLDFGLAKLLPASSGLLPARAYRTATGAQLGTPDYMSPEQLRGEKSIDHRTDIYALGVVAFEMITGKRPKRYADGSFDLEGTPSAVVGAMPNVPAVLAQLVETLLASDPNDRPSLVAVRAVIKRIRPSLPSMSVMDLDVSKVIAAGSAPELPSEMRASAFGARPILPTPPSGNPSIPPPQIPVSMPMVAQPEPEPEPAQPPQPSLSGMRSKNSSAIPHTRLGVPPPPATTVRRQPRATSVKTSAAGRLWLVVGIVLALAAGIAVAIVIAT